MAANLTVLCASKGRGSLRLLVKSFQKQKRIEGDRLRIFGDGWGEKWEEDGVTFEPSKKVGGYGHAHLDRGIRELETDYVTFMGDDDAYLPRSFERIRPYLKGQVVVSSFVNARHPKGIKIGPRHYGEQTKRLLLGGWQMFIPKGVEIGLLRGTSDAEVFRRVLKKEPHEFVDEPVMMFWAPRASERAWKRWGMGFIEPWSPEFVSWRSFQFGEEDE